MRVVLLVLVAASFLAAREPSAFEAGNLDSPNPYGLTSAEKHILKNRQEIDKLKKESFSVSERVRNLEEKLEGIKSVVEGLEERVGEIKRELSELKSSKEDETLRLEEKIERLKEDLNTTVSVQRENNEQIRSVLQELTSLIDNINKNYVSKSELKEEFERLYNERKKREKASAKSGAQIFKEAKALYKKKEYKRAKELFLLSIKKRYKPATSNFYIGEICYYTKDYECAVERYKKSVSIYSKSSFMPTLMLHTAISLERLGQKDEARLFYENLIKKFPKSKSAQIAKKRLKNLD